MTEPAVAPAPEPTPAVPAAPPAVVEPTPAAPPTDWRSSLPTDIQNHPSIADTKSVESLTRQYIDQGTLIGRKGVIPPADDSPAEMTRYYTELGRPVEPTGYKFGSMDAAAQTPEAISFLDGLRPSFHSHGLTDKQADGVVSDWLGAVAKSEADTAQAHDERARLTVANLQTKWGMAFEARQEMAKRAGEHLFGEEVMGQFAEAILPDGSRVGDHPGFIESLYNNLGAHMTEDELTKGTPGTSVMDPAGAKAERDKLMLDKDFSNAYFDTSNPEHRVAMDRMKALYKMENPEAPAA